jgi:hypothetical protein
VKLLKISLTSNSPIFHQNGSCHILSPNLTLKVSTPFYFLLFYLILAPSSLLHFHLPLAFRPFFMPKPKILFSTPGLHWRNPWHPRLPRQQRCRHVVHPERDRRQNPLRGSDVRIQPPDRPRRRICVESRARFLAPRPSEIGRKFKLLFVIGENPYFLAPRRRIRVSSSSPL